MKIIKSQDNKQLINTNEIQRFQISRIAKTSFTPSTRYRYVHAHILEPPVELTPKNSVYSIEAGNYTIASYTTEAQAQYVLDEILLFLTSNTNNLFVMPIDLGANYIL